MMSEETLPERGRKATDTLCLSCGLCCSGPFFGFVELQPGDDAIALGALLPLERKGDKIIFKLPCAAQRGACCSIYDRRPRICRGYRCRVLRHVEANPAELPGALEKVGTMVGSFAALKAGLGAAGFLATESEMPAAIKAFRMAYAAALAAGDAGFFTQHRELILRWKKTAWLMQAFDEKAAARLALPGRQPGPVAPPQPPGAG